MCQQQYSHYRDGNKDYCCSAQRLFLLYEYNGTDRACEFALLYWILSWLLSSLGRPSATALISMKKMFNVTVNLKNDAVNIG